MKIERFAGNWFSFGFFVLWKFSGSLLLLNEVLEMWEVIYLSRGGARQFLRGFTPLYTFMAMSSMYLRHDDDDYDLLLHCEVLVRFLRIFNRWLANCFIFRYESNGIDNIKC